MDGAAQVVDYWSGLPDAGGVSFARRLEFLLAPGAQHDVEPEQHEPRLQPAEVLLAARAGSRLQAIVDSGTKSTTHRRSDADSTSRAHVA